jgi:hypothetical protein
MCYQNCATTKICDHPHQNILLNEGGFVDFKPGSQTVSAPVPQGPAATQLRHEGGTGNHEEDKADEVHGFVIWAVRKKQ